MKESEAELNGYYYSGPSISAYPRQKEIDGWEKDKSIAKRLKKEYIGADYVIITGSKNGWLSAGSKAIYGNETFDKLWHALAYEHNTPKAQIELSQQRKAKIQAEYEANMKKEDEYIAKQMELSKWIDSIKK